MEREIYCIPCNATFKSRAEHLRLVKPESWTAINVPKSEPIEFEKKGKK